MNKKPRTYKSPILSELIQNISKEELEKTESKMRLALKIAEAIKAKFSFIVAFGFNCFCNF